MADAQALLFGRGNPPPAPAPSPGRGEGPERKLLTILFVDIVSSSAMVVGRDPEEADTSLLAILNVLVEAVDRYGGMVSQLLGDGFMAVFGAPDAKEDHALRACLAAQDIVLATANTSIPGFRIRVGLDAGDAVAQVVRSGQWTDYRTVGECVHVAAKLQQRSDPNTAQLSRSVLDLVPVGLTANPAGAMRLAPTAKPIPAYTLEGARAVRRTATDLLSSTTAPMVGREAERETLFSIAKVAAGGRAQTLVLRGDAGIGKSRLVGELLRDEMVRDWSLLHWAQMPIRRLGDPDDLEAVAQSLATLSTGTLNGDGPQRVAEAAGRLAGPLAGDAVRVLLGLPATHPMWPGLDPSQRLTLAIDGLVGAVLDRAACAGTGEQPLLILVEDAHWARPVMGRLLDALTSALSGTAAPYAGGPRHVLLLVTLRPPALGPNSVVEGWMPPRGVRRLELDALDPEQSRRFLDHWLGDDPSLGELKSQVSARSQGVPLYLEETLRSMEAAEDISGTPGSYRLVNPDITLRLPRSVHALLAARIDLLANDPRRVLMRAAVVGATFDVGLLQALRAVSDAALPDELSYLEQAGFVARARLLPNLEYVFRHGLIREVAYITITNNDRKKFHGQVVDALRLRRESNLPNRVELMAHHSFMAEQWPIAYAYGRRAGMRAERRSRLGDAGEFYKNSLTAIDHMDASKRNVRRMIDILIAEPRARLPRGLRDDHSYLQKARTLALDIQDNVGLAKINSLNAAFEWSHGDLGKAASLAKEALSVLPASSHKSVLIQLLVRKGGILAEQGKYERSRSLLTRARKEAMASDIREFHGLATTGFVGSTANLARCLAELGERPDAVALGKQAVEAADDLGHVFSQVYANSYLGWSMLQLGMFSDSIPIFENALSHCQATRTNLFLPFILTALSYSYSAAGSVAEGRDLFERHTRLVLDGSPKLWVFQIGLWHAEMKLMSHQYSDAIAISSKIERESRLSERNGYALRASITALKAKLRTEKPTDRLAGQIREVQGMARRHGMLLVAKQCEQLAADYAGSFVSR